MGGSAAVSEGRCAVDAARARYYGTAKVVMCNIAFVDGRAKVVNSKAGGVR